MAQDLWDALVAVVAVATLPLGTLALLFVDESVGIAVFVVGWFLLVPLLAVVGNQLLPALDDGEEAEARESASRDPLEELRERYASGEIDEAEFERRVEKLIATEGGDGPGVAGDIEQNLDLTRESGPATDADLAGDSDLDLASDPDVDVGESGDPDAGPEDREPERESE